MWLRQCSRPVRGHQNLVPSLDEEARNEVIAPFWFDLHAISAGNALKSCINLVPKDIAEAFYEVVEAFYGIVEARNEVVEAFCCDNLVRNLGEVVRNEVVRAVQGVAKGENRGFAPDECKNPLKSRARQVATLAGRVAQGDSGRRWRGSRVPVFVVRRSGKRALLAYKLELVRKQMETTDEEMPVAFIHANGNTGFPCFGKCIDCELVVQHGLDMGPLVIRKGIQKVPVDFQDTNPVADGKPVSVTIVHRGT